MTVDSLDTRFPLGRRVKLWPEEAEGVVIAVRPSLVRVQFDEDPHSDRSFTAEWFERHPTSLRLLPNLAAPETPK